MAKDEKKPAQTEEEKPAEVASEQSVRNLTLESLAAMVGEARAKEMLGLV